MATTRAAPAPLLLPVLAWSIGMVLQNALKIPELILVVASLALLLIGIILPKARIWLIILLFLPLGAMRLHSSKQEGFSARDLVKDKHSIRQPISYLVTSRLSSSTNVYAIRLQSLANQPISDNLLFISAQTMIPGERYSGLADISELLSDPILQIYPNRYSATARQVGKVMRLSPSPMRYAIARLRQGLMQNLEDKLGEDAAWAQGLLFSDTEAKKANLNDLSSSGLMHLIVVSGLHVWLIYLVLVSLLRILLPRGLAELIFLPVILLFAALNNWAPSITRSIIMIGTLIVARWMQRPLSGAQSISVSMFIITLISPLQLFSIGLQMSYLCIIIILYGMPNVKLFPGKAMMRSRWQMAVESLWEGILLSVLISIAITPLTLFYFGRATFNGVITNMLGISLMAILLPLSFMILIFPMGGQLSHLFILSYRYLAEAWQSLVQFGANIPLSFTGKYISHYHAISLAVVILVLFLFLRTKPRRAIIMAAPCLLLAAGLYYIPTPLSQQPGVHIFACGVADCSFIRLSDGSTIMIDTGGGSAFTASDTILSEDKLLTDSWMQKVLLPWLGKNEVNSLDYLIITHMHADHFGGLLSLLKQTRVKHIFISKATSMQPQWQFFASRAYFRPDYVHIIADTCSFTLGDSRIKFLHPDADFVSSNENELSLVCRIDTPDSKLLFTGDIGAQSEYYLGRKYASELDSDYLKIPHHGSRGSSTSHFLELTSPKEAWLSTSKINRFGFPHTETVSRFNDANIPIRSTAQGSIQLRFAQND
jgi:competence protein ComEC